MLAFLVSLIASVVATLRYLWRQQGWRRPDGQFFMLAFALLVVAQLAEGWAGPATRLIRICGCCGP